MWQRAADSHREVRPESGATILGMLSVSEMPDDAELLKGVTMSGSQRPRINNKSVTFPHVLCTAPDRVYGANASRRADRSLRTAPSSSGRIQRPQSNSRASLTDRELLVSDRYRSACNSKYCLSTLQIMSIELALEQLALPWKLLKDHL